MSAEFEPVIGLEVHVQLATATKLFCACPADGAGKAANANICPVCTGQPGALPVLNRRAAELAFTAALALGGKIPARSVFARKNYFYPDLPKGYQISQYEEPFCAGGSVALPGGRAVRLTRIHLEEDAGKLLHGVGSEKLAHSLVDLNRAGVPLIEIVTEPDLRSAEEAADFLAALKAVLQYCGVSRCDMEKGELRCDANISVRPAGSRTLGTRAEVKNLNSFRFVGDALDYEFRRQCAVLAEGGRVVQETRLWDADAGVTEGMRGKEEAHDYRYFPDPDLPPLAAAPELLERLRIGLPELPAARRARFSAALGLSDYDAQVLTADRSLADYFEAALESAAGEAPEAPRAALAKALANWGQSEMLARGGAEACPVPPARLAGLIGLMLKGTISGRIAKEIFPRMWDTGKAPAELVAELGMTQVSDAEQVAAWVAEAAAENPKAAADLRAGLEKAAGALVGAVMRKSQGRANPALVQRLIKERIR